MSYDLGLNDPITGEVLQLDSKHDMRGGTYQIGGCPTAHLNVTYNYSGFYREHLGDEGIRTIYGMTGAQSIPVLRAAADKLGDDVDEDYWAATEGNAKRALLQLIVFAELRPDGVWNGD